MNMNRFHPFVIETSRTFQLEPRSRKRSMSRTSVLEYPDVLVPILPDVEDKEVFESRMYSNGRYSHFSYSLHDVDSVSKMTGLRFPEGWDKVMTSSDSVLSILMGVHGGLVKDEIPFFINGTVPSYPTDSNGRVILVRVNGMEMEVAVAVAEPVGSVRYMIVSGYGQDSGYGDYSQPDYSDPITDKNGMVIWSDNPEKAYLSVEKLNEESSKRFYESGEHHEYSGHFPLEFKVVSVSVTDNPPFSEDEIIDTVLDLYGNQMLSEGSNPYAEDEVITQDYPLFPQEGTPVDIDKSHPLAIKVKEINAKKEALDDKGHRFRTFGDILFFDGEQVKSRYDDDSPRFGDMTEEYTGSKIPRYFVPVVSPDGRVTAKWDVYRGEGTGEEYITSNGIVIETSVGDTGTDRENTLTISVSWDQNPEGMEDFTVAAFASSSFIENYENIRALLKRVK